MGDLVGHDVSLAIRQRRRAEARRRGDDLAARRPVAVLLADAVRDRDPHVVGRDPAAGVVGEAMLAIVLADALLEKFGGDSMNELRRNLDGYMAQLAQRTAESAASRTSRRASAVPIRPGTSPESRM